MGRLYSRHHDAGLRPRHAALTAKYVSASTAETDQTLAAASHAVSNASATIAPALDERDGDVGDSRHATPPRVDDQRQAQLVFGVRASARSAIREHLCEFFD